MTRSTVKSLAKEIANEILKKNEEGLQNHTVKNAFEYYFKTKTVSKSTLYGKNSLFTQLESKGYLNKLIKDMNGATIREFIGKFTLMDSSAHSLYSRLMSVLKHYIQEHNLQIELPKGLIKNIRSKSKEDETFITWEEIKKLLALEFEKKEDKFFVDFFCLLSLTGMALQDGLKFTPQLNISDNEKWVVYSRKKTGAKCQLPLFPQAKAIIDKYDWPCRFSVRTIQYRCEHLISDLLGRKIKSHDGRKAFGCLCLTLGFSIESTAKFMGHSNPLITSRIYSKVLKEKVESEMDSLTPYAKQIMGI